VITMFLLKTSSYKKITTLHLGTSVHAYNMVSKLVVLKTVIQLHSILESSIG
jgi:hypothetical protein